MIKRLFFCFFIFSATISCYSNQIGFIEYNLENGLHVILHQDQSTPIVSINIMYHVGSKNERPDRTGFAHFFEHLMFEGSENINRGEYLKYVQNAGGQCNAFTSFDKTVYFETLPSNQLELGLWLESERLLHLKIDSTGVETQRKVVKEERKGRYENKPYGSFQEEIFSHAFIKHPYRWVPIGEVQYIDQATIDEFRAFHKQFYVPDNATLTICGDIEIEKTKKLVDKYFGNIPAGKHEIYRPNTQEPAHNKEERDTIYDNIRVPAIFQAYHSPPLAGKDYYAISLVENLLAKGESSRLFKNIIDKKQLAMQLDAFSYPLEDTGLFIIYALVNQNVEIDKLENAINEEIENLKTDTLSDHEFQKLLNQTETHFYSQQTSLENIGLSLANYHTFFGNANLINTEINNYLNVTKEDIIDVVNKYFRKENRVVLYYLPKQVL